MDSITSYNRSIASNTKTNNLPISPALKTDASLQQLSQNERDSRASQGFHVQTLNSNKTHTSQALVTDKVTSNESTFRLPVNLKSERSIKSGHRSSGNANFGTIDSSTKDIIHPSADKGSVRLSTIEE